MQQLDPKSIWLFFIGNLFVLFFLSFFILIPIGVFIGVLSEFMGSGSEATILSFIFMLIGIWFIFILGVPFISYFFAKLSYSNYKYEMREDGFRKEHGVIYKKYVTIPYERIQNVDIYRGLLARILGLSDLHIQTAGMSSPMGGAYGALSEGRLPGLSPSTAEKLRDELIKRTRGKNAGV